jgi:UDP-2,3-diacylglucosamine hydrolase
VPHTLFISDLHLPVVASPLRDAFGKFLAGPARQAEALYILGDLFEVWAGDDAGLRDYGAERAALRDLTAAGVPVFFQHGNRDFMVGTQFAAAAGLQILPDPVKVDIASVPTLISHGDVFCTDDVGYQRWRGFSRNPLAQRVWRAMPLTWRERAAGGIRANSDAAKPGKTDAIMDVNDGAIRAALHDYRVTRLIHGHTHRPADHDYEIDGRACRRHVLADWRPDRLESVRVDQTGVTRVPISA